jgi:DNA polymerase
LPLSPEAAQALRARLDYYRDLGVFDFYHRDSGAAGLAAADKADAPAADEAAAPASQIAPSTLFEEQTIARRNPASVPPPLYMPEQPVPAAQRSAALAAIRAEIGDCTRCGLAAGRHTIVFGDGDPSARLMFVGEGPGADEDASGIPFVGKAGQLLNNMIQAMGLKREQVYIANIVKCRPPSNRVPEPDEANTCVRFLFEQIAVVRPEVIVALGATAATYLLGSKSPLGLLRGRVIPAFATKLIVTYHPAFLLRDPRQKKEAWNDLKLAMHELGLPTPRS